MARVSLWICRHARAVLVIAGVVLILQAISGLGVFAHLKVGGVYATGSEATRADTAMDAEFPAGVPNLVLEIRSRFSIDDPQVRAAGLQLTNRLSAEPGIGPARSFWSPGGQALGSADGRTALVVARVQGDEDARKATVTRIYTTYEGQRGPLQIRFGGQLAAEREVVKGTERDLRRLETLAVPLVAVLMLLIFGGASAALLPLAIAGCSMITVLFVLRILGEVGDVSTYALNISTALSLGIGVDYGLFMLSRYREEIAGGLSRTAAIVQMNRSAGNTVIFSALTVALCLCSLLVVPLYYFRSVALAGITVVLSSAIAAIILMPALLALLGRRVERRATWLTLDRWFPGRATTREPLGDESGLWYRMTSAVMRRPIVSAAIVLIALGGMSLPVLRVQFSLPHYTALPVDSEAVQVQHVVQENFADLPLDALYVVSPKRRLAAETAEHLARAVSALPGVATVDSSVGTFSGGQQRAPARVGAGFESASGSWIVATLAVEPESPEAVRLVSAVREIANSDDLLVGGVSANLHDTEAILRRLLPTIAAVLAGSTMVLMFLFSGSLLIPLKAVVLSLLGLTATFGVLIWIFADGHLRWLLNDFQFDGTMELTTPIILFATAFGLSMDYEMFLIARIREEYLRTGDNVRSVAIGIQRSGRVVTSAAALFVLVMLAFSASDLSLVKMVGIGLAIAVVLDVTLIRAVLLPALMRLAGPANWWAPPAFRRLHNRLGQLESPAAAPADVSPVSDSKGPVPIRPMTDDPIWVDDEDHQDDEGPAPVRRQALRD